MRNHRLRKFNRIKQNKNFLEIHLFFRNFTDGTRSPNLLQNVTLAAVFLPVRWSNMWQVSKGGLYRCSDTERSTWLGFSTRCNPSESERNERNRATWDAHSFNKHVESSLFSLNIYFHSSASANKASFYRAVSLSYVLVFFSLFVSIFAAGHGFTRWRHP